MSLYTIDWTWTASDFKICLPILLTLVFFSIYWFTSKSKKIRERFYNKYDHDKASLKHIFFTKYFGFFSMGVFPTIICLYYLPELTLADLGLTLIYETSLFSLLWILGLSILIVPLVYFSAKNPKNLLNYPQIRAKVWTKKMICHQRSWLVLISFWIRIFIQRSIINSTSRTTRNVASYNYKYCSLLSNTYSKRIGRNYWSHSIRFCFVFINH